MTGLGAAHECVLLEYAEESKLYLPVENIELLSKYGHETGLLDKLGGGAWQAKKAKLKESIRQIAERLIRVAAERELRTAPALDPPDGLWDQFLARFPYVETDDQLAAMASCISLDSPAMEPGSVSATCVSVSQGVSLPPSGGGTTRSSASKAPKTGMPKCCRRFLACVRKWVSPLWLPRAARLWARRRP